jgi:hypothetical protein
MATTDGGELLFADNTDTSAELFYSNVNRLTDASPADRAALSDAYLAVLGMVKNANKLVRAAVAKVLDLPRCPALLSCACRCAPCSHLRHNILLEAAQAAARCSCAGVFSGA